MVIEEVRLRDFGKWEAARIGLGPGLNVLWGPNESGKSTLLAALIMLLFEKPSTTKAAALRRRRWGARRGYELGLTFSAQGRTWVLTKDFENQRSLLLDQDTGQAWEEQNEVQRRLAELVGTDSPAVYQSTAGLRQQEILGLQEGRKLGEMLQKTVSGAPDQISVEQVIARLQEALQAFQRGTRGAPTRHLGEIAAAEAQLATLREREREVAEAVRRTTAARETAERSRAEGEALDEEIADLRNLLARAQERRALEERRQSLQEQAVELQGRADRARDLERHCEQDGQELAGLPEVTPEAAREAWQVQQAVATALQQEEAAAQRLGELEQESRALESPGQAQAPVTATAGLLSEALALQEETARQAAEVEQRRQAVAAAEASVQRGKAQSTLATALLASGLGALLAAVLGGALVEPWYALGAIGGLGLVAWGLVLRARTQGRVRLETLAEARRDLETTVAAGVRVEARLQETLRQAGVNSLAELAAQVQAAREAAGAAQQARVQLEARSQVAATQQQEARRRREESEARLRELLAGRFASAEEMQQTVERRRALEHRIAEARRERDGLLQGTEEELEERRRALAVELAVLAQRLEAEQMVSAHLPAEELARLAGEVERKQARRDSLRREQAGAEALLQGAEYDAEDLAAAREQVAQAAARCDRLRRREQVLQIVLDTLRQAREETLLAATDVLEPAIGGLLSRLTRGRYDQVSVSRETLEPRVFSPYKGEAADQETDLSLATREQVYLACRLALVRLLWPQEGPPLLLDDPLVNFDEFRYAQALRLLGEFAQERQVLLFTCTEPPAPPADRVVDLTQV